MRIDDWSIFEIRLMWVVVQFSSTLKIDRRRKMMTPIKKLRIEIKSKNMNEKKDFQSDGTNASE